MDNCDNCGAAIGKLETPNVWQDHVVCAQCYAKLVVQPIQSPPLNPATYRPEVGRGEIICPNPNCGYVGQPKMKSRGIFAITAPFSIILFVAGLGIGMRGREIEGEALAALSVALFFGGLLVAIIAGDKRVCPRCGVGVLT